MSFITEETAGTGNLTKATGSPSHAETRAGIRAILCMNDRLAFGAYQATAELGMRVPDDLSLVSFDDDQIASYLRPGLTTIALPHQEMGAPPSTCCFCGWKGEHLVPMPVVRRGWISRSGEAEATKAGIS